jgi:hypothetical protein
VNQVFRCAICVASRNAAAAAGDSPPKDLPPVLAAVTLFGGTALCGTHVLPARPRPGDAARAAGLDIPGT